MKKYLITALFLISAVSFGQVAKVPIGVHSSPAVAFPIINLAIDQVNTNTTNILLRAPINNATLTALTTMEQLKVSATGVTITAITSDGANIHFWAGATELTAVPGSSGATWGDITGSMAAQNDLTSALSAKAPVATTMTTSHAANVITSTDLTHYGLAYSWGNHASAGYALASALSSYAPVATTMTTSHAANAITGTDITHWNSAYGWGNHASAGYATTSALSSYALTSVLTGYVPTTRTVNGHALSGNVTVTASDVSAVATADSLAMLSKYPRKASPTFTGVPLAPTAAASTNTTQIATTAFATTADNLKLNIADSTTKYFSDHQGDLVKADLADFVTLDSANGGGASNTFVTGHDFNTTMASFSSFSDSLSVLSSNPSTGNVYINSADKKIHYLVGGYWHRVAILDSVAIVAAQQNLLLYSEALNTIGSEGAPWGTFLHSVFTADQAVDLVGNTTLELLTISGGSSRVFQTATVTPGVTYTVSWDCTRGTKTELAYSIYDNTHSSYITAETSYYSETSGSVARITKTFTPPAGCVSVAINFISNASDITQGTVYFGRMQLSNMAGTYIVTTSTPVN